MLMIDARGLSRTFDGGKKGMVHAVRRVDLKVERGEIIALLGPNGAGKSTTLRMLTTLLAPSSGDAMVAGANLLTDPLKVRSRIGFVQQAIGKTMGGTDNQCTVIDELLDQAALYRIDKDEAVERAELLAEQLDLTGLENRLVKTLSGGQRRRLEIALGLVHEPPLVFLDEPTTALDPQSRANMWEHIRALRDNLDTTIVLTTHYLDEADMLCDRLFVIDNGETIAEGSPEELKQRVSSDIVTLEVPPKATEHAHRLLVQQPIVQDVALGQPGHLKLNVFHGAEALPALLRVMDSARIPLQSINLARPSLDDVFLTMTGRSLRDDSASATKAPKPRPRLEASGQDRRKSLTGPMPAANSGPIPAAGGRPDRVRPRQDDDEPLTGSVSRPFPRADSGAFTGPATRADLPADPQPYGADPQQATGQRPAYGPRPGGTGPRPAFSPQPGFSPNPGSVPRRGSQAPRPGRPQGPGPQGPRPQAPQPGFDPIPRVDPLERAVPHGPDTRPPADPRQDAGNPRIRDPRIRDPRLAPRASGPQPGYAGPDPRQNTGQRPAYDPRQADPRQGDPRQGTGPRPAPGYDPRQGSSAQPTVRRRAASTARPALPAAPPPKPKPASPGPAPTQAQAQVPDPEPDAFGGFDPQQATGPRPAYDPLQDSGVGGFDPLRDSGVQPGGDPYQPGGAPAAPAAPGPAFNPQQPGFSPNPGFDPQPGYDPQQGTQVQPQPGYDPRNGTGPQPGRRRRPEPPDADPRPDNDQWQPAGGRHASRDR